MRGDLHPQNICHLKTTKHFYGDYQQAQINLLCKSTQQTHANAKHKLMYQIRVDETKQANKKLEFVVS